MCTNHVGISWTNRKLGGRKQLWSQQSKVDKCELPNNVYVQWCMNIHSRGNITISNGPQEEKNQKRKKESRMYKLQL